MIEKQSNGYLRVSKVVEGVFQPKYIFALKERNLDDFIDRSEFNQTNPTSHFTKGSILSKPTDEGRLTITEVS
ncbi:arylamine N-acetyltransferase [Halosquirtibacter xylanolyticus]|nr:arylamine N-acetyltransferase [Prolixibacteraceae bacterium]